MNILIIDDTEACGLDFAWRCIEYGHSVKLFRKPDLSYGEGFPSIQMVDDYKKHMVWAKEGLIINTGNAAHLTELDRYRKEFGFEQSIFSPSWKSAQLEIDRKAGIELLEKAGIPTPPYQEFASLEEAQKAVLSSDKCWVFKTLGSEEDKSLSFVSCSPDEMYGWLQAKIDGGLKLKGKCILQEKIDLIAEVGCSGWMGSEGFLENKWQVCFEHKKMMDGEKYVTTGETGTALQFCKEDRIAEGYLKPLEKEFLKLGHRGDTAVNGGIDAKGNYHFFEFTERFGYPAHWAQTASHEGDPAQWMKDSLQGKDTLVVNYNPCIVVVLFIPPFPFDAKKLGMEEKIQGLPIQGFEDHWDDIHPVSVKIGNGYTVKNGKAEQVSQFQTSGEYVACVTSLDPSLKKCQEKVYKIIEDIKIPDLGYRTDIADKVMKVLPELHELGYALDMQE